MRRPTWRKAARAVFGLVGATASLTGGATAQAAEELVEPESLDMDCRLIVMDNFKLGEASHGHKVGLAAESVGVDKEVIDLQLDQGGLRLQRIKDLGDDSRAFADPSKTVTELADAFDRKVEQKVTTQLDILSTDLSNLGNKGYRYSTANISQGTDEAGIADRTFREATLALRTDKPNLKSLGEKRARNYARLFDLDADKILSQDSEISGPERQKLQQAIIERVHKVATTSEKIATAKARWEGVVDAFESDHNSVVVAAGNSARVDDSMVAENGGHELNFPETFFNNVVAVDNVTTVGAITPVTLEGRDHPIEIVATYTSPGQGVDILANGDVFYPGGRAQGTSFAAPKASAVTTDVHCDYPEFTSEQVEAYIADNLSRDLKPYGKGLTVLNTD